MPGRTPAPQVTGGGRCGCTGQVTDQSRTVLASRQTGIWRRLLRTTPDGTFDQPSLCAEARTAISFRPTVEQLSRCNLKAIELVRDVSDP
jgi:hypothetical protein